MGVSGPVLAILLTFVVHVLGGALLIWALAGSEILQIFSTKPDEDGGTPPPPPPPEAPPTGPRDGLPLPDAVPPRVRVRGPHRSPRPSVPRRPEHAPGRTPARTPGRS